MENKLIEIEEEVAKELEAAGFSAAEINCFKEEHKPVPTDLSRFHKYDQKGNIIGIFDAEICDYLMENEDIFILGEIPYIYQKGVYRPDRTGQKIKAKIQDLIFKEKRNIRTIERVYGLLLIQPDLIKESWNLNQFQTSWLNFENGMLDVRSGKLLPHNPRYFSINQIPHKWKALTAKDKENYQNSKRFLQSSLFPQDMKTLFQFMGLAMGHCTEHQFFLVLLGGGGNGKSIVINILENIVGLQNISNESLERLTNNRFAPANLFGKTLNTCADISSIKVTDDAVLKKITGGDMVIGELKGQTPFYFQCYSKLIFSCNKFPFVEDKSDGFRRRTRVVLMDKKPEHPDGRLKEKLLNELEYFIFLAVQGYREVLETGKIFESENSKQVKEEIHKKADSVLAFVSDCLQPIEGQNIKRADAFLEYNRYCDYFERTPVKKSTFFEEMKFKGVVIKRNAREGYIYHDYGFKLWREDEQNIFSVVK